MLQEWGDVSVAIERKTKGEEKMYDRKATAIVSAGSLVSLFVLLTAGQAAGQLNLGPEQCVQSDGLDIAVPGYSVPSFVYWDGDDLKDLIVGEGSGTETARVRIYLEKSSSQIQIKQIKDKSTVSEKIHSRTHPRTCL